MLLFFGAEGGRGEMIRVWTRHGVPGLVRSCPYYQRTGLGKEDIQLRGERVNKAE